MEMTLYITKDSENVINKTKVQQDVLNIELKNIVDMINPVIVLKDPSLNMVKYNYCYLSDFKRFYFIRDIQTMNSDMFTLVLECDVLESFKSDILNSLVNYVRPIKQDDYMDFNPNSDLRKEVDLFTGDFELEQGKNIVLSSIGGAGS